MYCYLAITELKPSPSVQFPEFCVYDRSKIDAHGMCVPPGWIWIDVMDPSGTLPLKSGPGRILYGPGRESND